MSIVFPEYTDEAPRDETTKLRAERDRLQGRVATLQKALDDHFAADRKAAKAIFKRDGRKWSFPDTVEVVEWYVAEVERLTAMLRDERVAALRNEAQLNNVKHELADSCANLDIKTVRAFIRVELERDSLRAKLDRAKEALVKVSETLVFMRVKGSVAIAGFVRDTDARAPVVEMLDRLDAAIVDVRTVYAELSADAPAQPQISDEVREAMVEAEKALERIYAECSESPQPAMRQVVATIAKQASAKLMSVMK